MTWVRRERGMLGLALIAAGVVAAGLNIRASVNPVVLSVSQNHGVHLLNLVGAMIVAVGTILVWRR